MHVGIIRRFLKDEILGVVAIPDMQAFLTAYNLPPSAARGDARYHIGNGRSVWICDLRPWDELVQQSNRLDMLHG